MKWLQRAMLKLRDGCQVQVTLGVQPYSSKTKDPINGAQNIEGKNSIKEDQSLSVQSKQQYLQTIGVDDCIKDKVTKCYLMQIKMFKSNPKGLKLVEKVTIT